MAEFNLLPTYIKNILWDVDPVDFMSHLQNYRQFLAVRIAEKGNSNCLQWFIQTYSAVEFLQQIRDYPKLSPMTKNFWF